MQPPLPSHAVGGGRRCHLGHQRPSKQSLHEWERADVVVDFKAAREERTQRRLMQALCRGRIDGEGGARDVGDAERAVHARLPVGERGDAVLDVDPLVEVQGG